MINRNVIDIQRNIQYQKSENFLSPHHLNLNRDRDGGESLDGLLQEEHNPGGLQQEEEEEDAA